MGRSNRRRQRTNAPRGNTPQQSTRVASPKPAWRETLDSWGGFPVLGALVLVVVALGALIYANRGGSSMGTEAFTPTDYPPTSGRTLGDPNAPVTIIEFADFQCPFCKAFADDVKPQVVDEFVRDGTAKIQYVSFAFLGEESRRAAEAAECAADQNLFWQYHDLLFLRQGRENSGVYSTGNLKNFADELKTHFPEFDTQQFDQCLDTGAKRASVEQQTEQARSAGITSTPSFVINGRLMSGVQPIEMFREVISQVQGGGR